VRGEGLNVNGGFRWGGDAGPLHAYAGNDANERRRTNDQLSIEGWGSLAWHLVRTAKRKSVRGDWNKYVNCLCEKVAPNGNWLFGGDFGDFTIISKSTRTRAIGGQL
jgi:hypothetical protein